jgi:isoleucyl-tRNA synthetase
LKLVPYGASFFILQKNPKEWIRLKKIDVKESARARELRVLQYWREADTFKESIRSRTEMPPFVFYEGPPTANGAPHIGHVLGRVIKDFICRYKTMSGYKVIRKAGWDTHGLPVELGVEKQLGISGKQEIEEYGIGKFVEKCKSSVFEYEKQWRELTEAIGYWTDLDDPYITLTNDYIESVWHILSTIHQRGLLYRGHRVSPYCPCCQTTLSSHEVAQGYEEVKDLSATVKFRLKNTNESLLAWTTTPWTLPANAALAANPNLEYARVKQEDSVYIVAFNLVEKAIQGEYEILSTIKGAELIGKAYEPPFRYVDIEHGHIVIDGDFVSDSSGTGIVHIAPAHGEDDYRSARHHGISMLNVVDGAGKYNDAVKDFAGRFVKDCDVDIVKWLSERGLLYSKEKYEHSYPFCWRCKSPLLYYAMESWFIRTTALKDRLMANNSQVLWYPAHLRDGRFGKFLEELVDWNISRNRYWGTPLNVWLCLECGAEYAPHSHKDLREKAASKVSERLELHRPYIDEVQLKCPQCSGMMERTPEVIDVWFDSGSMPFAQYHYPFENEKTFHEQYPADMIVEGIDQTRGWFYSLLAVSTLFNDHAPYKTVMATGHVLDENGQKMSKSKGNVIDPWEIIHEYGTDAFRWALLSDSAPWNSKRFSKQSVAEAKSKMIDTLHNTHAFYSLYAAIDHFKPEEHAPQPKTNRLDRWIISRLNNVVLDVRTALDKNDFLNPAKRIEAFVDELSNWYVRRSRDRFWGSGMSVDKICAYQTLREVLLTLSGVLAPFTPFIADDIFRNLDGQESVHLTDYPASEQSAIDYALENDMETVRQIVELARNIRNESRIKTRQPLSELMISMDSDFDVKSYEDIIKEEINVKKISLVHDDNHFIEFSLKLNLKIGGPKYGKQVGVIQNYLRQVGPGEARKIIELGYVEIKNNEGEVVRISTNELLTEKYPKKGFESASGYQITVALKTEITPELAQEGFVREVVRAIQDYRKQLDLPIEKRIRLLFDVDLKAKEAIERFQGVLIDNVLIQELSFGKREGMNYIAIGDTSVGMLIK